MRNAEKSRRILAFIVLAVCVPGALSLGAGAFVVWRNKLVRTVGTHGMVPEALGSYIVGGMLAFAAFALCAPGVCAVLMLKRGSAGRFGAGLLGFLLLAGPLGMSSLAARSAGSCIAALLLIPRKRKRNLERDNFPAEVLRITAHRTLLAIKANGVAVWDVYRGIGRGAFAVASRSSLEEQGVAVFGHGLAVSAGTQSAVYELATGARIHDFDGRNVRAIAAPALMAGYVFVATRSESEGRARGSVFRWPPVGRELVGSSFNPPGFVPGWDPQMHPRPD